MVFQAAPQGLWAPHTWAFGGPFTSLPSLLQSWLPLYLIGPRSGLPLFLQSKFTVVFHLLLYLKRVLSKHFYLLLLHVYTYVLSEVRGQLLGGVYPSTFSSDGQVSLTVLSTLASGAESFFLTSEMCVKP